MMISNNNTKKSNFLFLCSFVLLLSSCEDSPKYNYKDFDIEIKKTKNVINECVSMPDFPKNHGLSLPYTIDLDKQKLSILGSRGRRVQLKDWANFGQIGTTCLDDEGNIFTFPRPFVNRFANPSKEQNKV